MAPPKRLPLLVYLKLEDEYIRQINAILARTSRELSRQIARSGDRNPLTRMQLAAQKEAIDAALAGNFKTIEDLINKGQHDMTAAASRVISQYEDELLKVVLTREAMEQLAVAEAARARAGTRALMDRLVDRKPLSDAVYDTAKLVSGEVDKAINTALARGMNAREFAAYMKRFISPSVPGGASYAAQRLARTELNNAFHYGSNKRYNDSGIVTEVDWNLSSSHPEGDICDTYAQDSPYPVTRVPQKPHPNCYCFTTPVLMDRKKFIDTLLRGGFGDEPWEPYADLSRIQ